MRMSADKWTTFIAHKFQTVISLEIDEFLRISFMFDHQEENGFTMYYVFLLIYAFWDIKLPVSLMEHRLNTNVQRCKQN